MSHIVRTVKEEESTIPEERYLSFFCHHIANALTGNNKPYFNKAIDQLFQELSQDTEIISLKQIALAYEIGSFVSSKETRDWLNLRSPMNSKRSSKVCKSYRSLRPKLDEIVYRKPESP